MNKKIEEWEGDGGKTTAQMLNQDQNNFEMDKSAFLVMVRRAVNEWVQDGKLKETNSTRGAQSRALDIGQSPGLEERDIRAQGSR